MSKECDIEYSERYRDDFYEYRHVKIPKSLSRQIPCHRLLSELEWRAIGITQSRGWEHYLLHKPEPNILLFRRPIQTDLRTGKIINGNNNPYNWQINNNNNNHNHNDNGNNNNDNDSQEKIHKNRNNRPNNNKNNNNNNNNKNKNDNNDPHNILDILNNVRGTNIGQNIIGGERNNNNTNNNINNFENINNINHNINNRIAIPADGNINVNRNVNDNVNNTNTNNNIRNINRNRNNNNNNSNNNNNNNNNDNLKPDWKPSIESCLPTLKTMNLIQNLIVEQKKFEFDSKYGY